MFATRAVRVFAYGSPVDMRKGFEGLSALVRLGMSHDPLSGDLYLFVNRHRKRAKILESDVIHADETWWRLMEGRGSKRWWSWSLSTEEAAHYRIVPQRSAAAARDVLGEYRGTVMADGYGVYESLARDGPRFVLANCWSHARRNFVEIEPNYPSECREVLGLIGELYGVERLAPRIAGLQGPQRQEALEARARLRAEHSRPIVDRIWQWATTQTGTPQSGLRKAVMYLLERRVSASCSFLSAAISSCVFPPPMATASCA